MIHCQHRLSLPDHPFGCSSFPGWPDFESCPSFWQGLHLIPLLSLVSFHVVQLSLGLENEVQLCEWNGSPHQREPVEGGGLSDTYIGFITLRVRKFFCYRFPCAGKGSLAPDLPSRGFTLLRNVCPPGYSWILFYLKGAPKGKRSTTVTFWWSDRLISLVLWLNYSDIWS